MVDVGGNEFLFMTQRAINGPYIYFVTTNITFGWRFFTTAERAKCLGEIIHNACRMKHFDLLGYCILPNHVHMLVQNMNISPIASQPGFRNPRCDEKTYTLSNLMHSIKRNFARQYHRGRVWPPRYNYRIVENQKYFENALVYMKHNFRKAHLPEYFGQGPFVYINTARP